MYKAVISNGLTEYLGVKNSPGYVKVYDKAKETRMIVGDMTRIELTCAGDWSAKQLMTQWPQVHGWTPDLVDEAPPRSQGWLRVVGLLLAERAERGEEIESYVQMLNWKQKAHVRTYLRTPLIELPFVAAEIAIAEAKSWEERFW